MKDLKLDQKGIAHVFIILVVVLVVGAIGVYMQVASHANSRKSDRQKYATAILKQANKGHIDLVTIDRSDVRAKTTPRENLRSAMDGRQSRTTQDCHGRGGTASNLRDANIDMNVLKFLYSLSKHTNYKINSIVGQCHSGGSNHYTGSAVDLGCPLDVKKADRIAKKYGLSRNSETCRANSHYHYSTNGR